MCACVNIYYNVHSFIDIYSDYVTFHLRKFDERIQFPNVAKLFSANISMHSATLGLHGYEQLADGQTNRIIFQVNMHLIHNQLLGWLQIKWLNNYCIQKSEGERGDNERKFETWLIISIASSLEWLISALVSSDRCQQNVRYFTV